MVTEGQITEVPLELVQLEALDPSLEGDLLVRLSENDADVFLDGRAWPSHTEGTTVIGPHHLEVRRPGFLPWSEQIDVRPGRPTAVEVLLRPTEEYRENYERRAWLWQSMAITTTVLAAAILGTATGLLVWNLDRDEQRKEDEERLSTRLLELSALMSRDLEPTDPQYQAYEAEKNAIDDELNRLDGLRNELRWWNVALSVGYALGGVAAVTGVVLFCLAPKPRRYRNLSWQPFPGGAQLALSF